MTMREAMTNLIVMIDREGGYRTPRDQITIAQARTLLTSSEERPLYTVVRCDTPNCPARLELAGDLDADQANAIAREMRWRADDTRHGCPACCEGRQRWA